MNIFIVYTNSTAGLQERTSALSGALPRSIPVNISPLSLITEYVIAQAIKSCQQENPLKVAVAKTIGYN